MNRILPFIFFLYFSCIAFSQNLNKHYTPKNAIKFSPNVIFDWSAGLKTKKNIYNNTNLITGFNVSYQRKDKLENYHDVGFIVGIIPVNSKNVSSKSTYNGKQFGVKYNYKIVYAKFKNNNLQFYTAVGTQLVYRKSQSIDYNLHKTTTNSVIHNFVVAPGLQYSKNNFFIDFSLPTSIGYNISKQKSFYPVFDTNQNQSGNHNSAQKYNLMNWNLGFETGVGAKF